MEVMFHLEVLEYVAQSGSDVNTSIKQFADCKVGELHNVLIHRAKLIRADKDVVFTLLREAQGRGAKKLEMDKSLIDNGILEGSRVQVRPPNIRVCVKPSGISVNGDGKQFVGNFEVLINPVNQLREMVLPVLKAGHLKHPREELKFSLILEKGAPRGLDVSDASDDWKMPLIKLGFFDKCELLVEKK